MGVNVTLIMPTINRREMTSFASSIAERWGGLTTWAGFGVWKNGKGQLIWDSVTVFSCSIQDVIDGNAYEWWHSLADAVRRTFKQECVFLSFTPQDAELVGDGFTERIGGNDANLSDLS